MLMVVTIIILVDADFYTKFTTLLNNIGGPIS